MMALLVIKYIEEHFPSEKDTWDLVVMKTKNFLESEPKMKSKDVAFLCKNIII